MSETTTWLTPESFERLKAEDVHLFYVKSPVEFGMLGEPDR